MHTPRIIVRILAIVAGATITVSLLLAQSGGGKGGATGGAGGNATGGSSNTGGFPGNSGGINSRPGSIYNPTNPGATSPGDTRPIFLSGKVMFSDGTAPTEPIMIERVCNGTPRPEGYTDSKGRFSFQLGENRTAALADASYDPNFGRIGRPNNAGGGIRESELWGCDLRASLAGFRSDTVSLASRRSMDNPEVGTIILHRNANVEGLTTSATNALAPKAARSSYEKGMEAIKKTKLDEAKKDFEKAVELYPKYAYAWFELGKLQEQRDHAEEARKAYEQALAADSKYINPYERLYIMAAKDSKWQEVAEGTDRVLRLNPYDFPSAYYFNGLANLQLNHLDAAEKSMREAIKLDTAHRNPRSGYILGVILAQKQEFTASADLLREYLKVVQDGKEADFVRTQLADVEKFAQAKAETKQP
jgi:tetratricopeptide (TPR) repeat protein